jgi:hypothetical protein
MKKTLSLYLFLIATICFCACIGSNAPRTNKQKQADEASTYNRSKKASYENRIRYSAFAPFLYEDKFYAYYSLAYTPSNPDKNGYSEVVLKNGPKAGQTVRTKNIIYKTRAAQASDLKKGQVVLVNHWNPKVQDENARIDIWRKGIVYNLDEINNGKVMLEFPHDQNDFMATKETYLLQNIRLIMKPILKDPRNFIE